MGLSVLRLPPALLPLLSERRKDELSKDLILSPDSRDSATGINTTPWKNCRVGVLVRQE